MSANLSNERRAPALLAGHAFEVAGLGARVTRLTTTTIKTKITTG